jgi:hypothetical protein
MHRAEKFQMKAKFAAWQLSDVFSAVMGSNINLPVLAEYLWTLHSIIVASEDLLESAAHASRMREKVGEKGCRELAMYLENHLAEERDHARWLWEDIQSIGQPLIGTLTSMSRSTAVAALVGSQHYWIRYQHPAMILGYIAILEGFPLTEERINSFMFKTGAPARALRTLFLHAKLDPTHREDFNRFLIDLPVPDDVFARISQSSIATCRFCAEAFLSMPRVNLQEASSTRLT